MFRRFALLLLPLAACSNNDARLCADANADTGDAIAACTRLLELPEQKRSSRADWYFSRAHHAIRSNAFEEAIADFSRAIDLDPKDAVLYVNRGVTYGKVGKLDPAQRDFEHAILLDPALPEGHLNHAKILSDTNRFPEALAAFDRTLSLTDEYWIAFDGRCWVRAVLGEDLDGALSDCNRALAMQPGAANPLNNRGLVHYRMNRYAESVADYTASIAADPNMASSYYVRGLGKRALGDHAGAEADIAEALRREPGVADRYASYGVR